jgi:TolB-like protein
MKRLIALSMMLMGTVAWAAGPAKVLLIPFDSVGPSDKEWVAKALQQNLLAELSRNKSVQATTAERSTSNLETALRVAGEAKADYVVFGSYQAVDGDLRMTGQVIDVNTKQAVAGLKSTGAQRDLFGMEDVIASQVKRALPQPVAEAQPEMLKQPLPPPPAVEPTGPVAMGERARQLEEDMNRAIDRIRYSPYYGADDYYGPDNYVYSGFYSPFYPIYYNPVYRSGFHHHRPNGGGNGFHGSFHGGNFSGGVSIGGGRTVGNYANFGRMSMNPTVGGSGIRR